MYHEQLVKHNNLNTKMNLHNDDDNVNDGDIHVIIIMLAYNLHAHLLKLSVPLRKFVNEYSVIPFTNWLKTCLYNWPSIL